MVAIGIQEKVAEKWSFHFLPGISEHTQETQNFNCIFCQAKWVQNVSKVWPEELEMKQEFKTIQ